MGLSVFAKIQSTNDKHGKSSWSDYAIGIDLAVSAIILLIVKSMDYYVQLNRIGLPAQKILAITQALTDSLSGVFGFILLTWLLCAFIRGWGWKSKSKLNTWGGVLIPDGVGGLFLVWVIHYF
jgi:hypothetical protein